MQLYNNKRRFHFEMRYMTRNLTYQINPDYNICYIKIKSDNNLCYIKIIMYENRSAK